MNTTASHVVHVAVGVIINQQGQILIAKRPDHLHQGGLWEFPGGKVDAGETVTAALQRELQEEVGLHITDSTPLITIAHDYGDKQVYLDVHRITQFQGEATGCEGQLIRWITPQALAEYDFPRANRPIISALQLPQCYAITGEFANTTECIAKLHQLVAEGVELIQLRAKGLSDTDYVALAQAASLALDQTPARLLLNTSVDIFTQTQVDGLHLTSQQLMVLTERPIPEDKLLAASIHNQAQLEQANKVGVDFVVLSPVLATSSHPDTVPLGWSQFAELTQQAVMPVYALGGLSRTDVALAQNHGAQGIAGISAFWH